MPYKLEVLELPSRDLVGIGLRTDMQNAGKDCPDLWQKFMPHMQERCEKPLASASGQLFFGESFGVSKLVDLSTGVFDYFAAVPCPQDEPLPKDEALGLERLRLEGGLYARCGEATLAELTSIYMFIYQQWLPQQANYGPDIQRASFERYDESYLQNGTFEVYVPLLPKE